MTIRPGVTPCLRCVFPDLPAPGTSPTCDTAGVILPVVAAVASDPGRRGDQTARRRDRTNLHGGLLQFDVWENRFARVSPGRGGASVATAPPASGASYEFLTARGGQLATTLCGRGAVQVTSPRPVRLDLPALAERLRSVACVELKQFVVRFRVGDVEMTVFPDARSIIKGVADPAVARGLYARYVGA